MKWLKLRFEVMLIVIARKILIDRNVQRSAMYPGETITICGAWLSSWNKSKNACCQSIKIFNGNGENK